MAFRDEGPRHGPVVVLVHGSPGSGADFEDLVPALRERYRVLVVDLPGFGRSSTAVPDYSLHAHAAYLDQFLERVQVEAAHVLGFSMGGGVALELYGLNPRRIRSLILVASIGVQEMELLGSYELNHSLYALQLWALRLLDVAVPHFGLLEAQPLNTAYARNFFDTDQRPLREIIAKLEPPVLIVHGRRDPLVPYAAALEHRRLIPQSELLSLDASHFLLWTHADVVLGRATQWIEDVERGEARSRSRSSAPRVAASQAAPAEGAGLQAEGLAAAILVSLLVLGTFLSEDLTGIAAGLLIAQGRLDWATGLLAVFCGIFFGDLLLYAAGRVLGRRLLRHRPWRWLLREEDLLGAARWFDERGMVVILLSRFVPGTRLPTYVAAGLVRARFALFAIYFLVAVALWTPLLVGLSAALGEQALEHLLRQRNDSLFIFGLTVLSIFGLLRLLVPLITDRGRRLWRGRLCRWRRWEFWPAWVFYLPVFGYILRLAWRYRGLSVMTAVNPGIPAGGFVGESKTEILDRLGGGEEIARYGQIRRGKPDERAASVERFLAAHELDYPVVIKPDAGHRGSGVVIVRDPVQLRRVLAETDVELLVQEYVGGREFGIFYARHPREEHGRVLSVTVKVLPRLEGDGVHSLEYLILHDERAVCLAPEHLRVHAARLHSVPSRGVSIPLVELGTHCRGAIFLDGAHLRTSALEQWTDRLARRMDGFFFGRFDVKVPSEELLRAGTEIKVLELNGLTSEMTHLYDPSHSLRDAYRILFSQWKLAFEIGAWNRAQGHRTWSVGQLLEDWTRYRSGAKRHPNRV
jgi:pimeloyl-ACP methyl ester carboxylesterase/membrane protein DedA with SNARE-associated domain